MDGRTVGDSCLQGDGWRLPTTPGLGIMDTQYTLASWTDEGELAHLYYDEWGATAWQVNGVVGPISDHGINTGPFGNEVMYGGYWAGVSIDTYTAWDFVMGIGNEGKFAKDADNWFMIVHDGDVGPDGPIPAPEPMTVMLLGPGLVGILGLKRKFTN